MSNGKPIYRNREYYYQDDRTNSKINQLKQKQTRESSEYTQNQHSQGQYNLNSSTESYRHKYTSNRDSQSEHKDNKWSGVM